MEDITIECPQCHRTLDLSFVIGQKKIQENSRTCHICHQPYIKIKLVKTKQPSEYRPTHHHIRQPEITKEMLEALKPKEEKIYSGETRYCKYCKNELPIEEFSVDLQKQYRIHRCKKCVCNYSKSRYIKNREIISAKQKILRKENVQDAKNKANECRKKREAANPEYYRLLKARAAQKRRLSRRVRNRLSEVLKGERGLSFSKMLGCSSAELRACIESKFLSGMTWDNYGFGHGQWVIDHVKPVALFDKSTRESLSKSCHYLNLQPLWYDMNEAKSDNYDPDHPMGWHGLDKFLVERGEPTPWLVG